LAGYLRSPEIGVVAVKGLSDVQVTRSGGTASSSTSPPSRRPAGSPNRACDLFNRKEPAVKEISMAKLFVGDLM
jgi:hypothetical protein